MLLPMNWLTNGLEILSPWFVLCLFLQEIFIFELGMVERIMA